MPRKIERLVWHDADGVGGIVYALKAWEGVFGCRALEVRISPGVAALLARRNRGNLWAQIYRTPLVVDDTFPAGTWEVVGDVDDRQTRRRLASEREQAEQRYLTAFGRPSGVRTS